MLNINIESKNDITIINLEGEFTYQSIPFAREVLDLEKIQPSPIMAVNCGDLAFIDSVGIGILTRLYKNAKKNDIEFIIYDLNETIQSLFRIARIDDFYTILSREDFENKYLS